MSEIDLARKNIEQIDKKIASLFEERMESVKVIGEYKRNNGLPVLDEEREKALVERNVGYITNPDMEAYYRDFMRSMMSISKRYQHRLLSGIRVAYSGIEGSFASISCRKLFPNAEKVSCMNFAEAYQKVCAGKCDFAVLPIENSYAGEVGQVLDLIFDGELFVNGVYELGISHCLLGVEGSSVDTINTVVSHPQALEQCDEYIYSHKFHTIQAENTARAAKGVSDNKDVTVGAIASQETAELYGLKVLEHSINKSNINVTRFAVLSKGNSALSNDKHKLLDFSSDHNTFIMMFIVKHEAGTLANALSIIGEYGYNMRVIRSRPLKEKNWQYYFYAEIEGDISTEAGEKMLNALGEYCEALKVVGSYKPDVRI